MIFSLIGHVFHRFYPLMFGLIMFISGCEYSELWRHRQDTLEIQARMPEKQRLLDELNTERVKLQQTTSSLRSDIQSRQTSLEELESQSDLLETQLDAVRDTNKKLNFDITRTRARSQYLKQQIAILKKEQIKQLDALQQIDVIKARRIEQLKSELDVLLKVIAKQ